MGLVIRFLGTALAVALAAWLLPGISLTSNSTLDKALTLAIVAALIGVVNTVVKPFVTALTGCLVFLTLGLFLLVINAAMLLLVGWLSGKLGVGFSVDGFWSALIGSIIISFVSGAIHGLFARPLER